jgi:Phytanoyl-CoA dioxygenase (PhyH)
VSLFRRRRPDVVAASGEDTYADVLGEADALVRAGRSLEAIELLTLANRRSRRDDIERRLVRLRHQAFADLDPSASLPSWPPDAPDLFPGVVGLPEIAAADLTADAIRSGIVGHGALIVRRLIPPARVAQLVADIDQTFAAQDAFFDGASHAQAAPWFVPFQCESEYPVGPTRRWVRGGGGVLTVESPRALFDVLDAFEEVGLAGYLADYLGERPVLAAKKFTLRRVPLEKTADWHQDGAFLGKGIRAVNVWVALSPCGEDSPGLDVVARRMHEIAPTGTEGAWFDWSVGAPVVDRVAEGAPVQRPIFAAGDAVLFDEMLLHRTAVEPEMTRERYAIESWFFAPSQYPTDQIPLTF